MHRTKPCVSLSVGGWVSECVSRITYVHLCDERKGERERERESEVRHYVTIKLDLLERESYDE